jgi:hypothetical protein
MLAGISTVRIRAVQAVLCDFEPHGRVVGLVVVAAYIIISASTSLASSRILNHTGIRTSRHIRQNRTLVTFWPRRPTQIHGRACGCWSVQSRGFRSNDAAGCVAAALEVDESDIFDGEVALYGAGYARWLDFT